VIQFATHSLRHMVGAPWCARGVAFQLGQDRLGHVWFGYWTIEMDRILSLVSSRRQHFFQVVKFGHQNALIVW